MQIRTDIQEHMATRNKQILAMLEAITPVTSDSSSESDQSSSPDINHIANFTSDQTQLEILKLLKE